MIKLTVARDSIRWGGFVMDVKNIPINSQIPQMKSNIVFLIDLRPPIVPSLPTYGIIC